MTGEDEPRSNGPGLTGEEARRRLAAQGPNEVPEEPPHPWRDLARRFWGPVPWMLEAALALELVLGKVPEATILFALLCFNALVAYLQEHRAGAAVALLRRRLSVSARALRDGAWTTVPARELVVGDRIHLRMGDIVPADGRLVDGEVEIDQATLTGESEPVTRSAGATLYSSSIVRRGEASADVTATGPRSYFGRTTELVRSATSVSHLQTLLFGIVRYLVSLDAAMAVLVLVIGELRGVPLAEVLPFVLILIIASVPAAMPATFTIANALESRQLVDEGVLVTGLSAVQEAASMDVLCVDKTGTLTEGKESLAAVSPSAPFDETRLLALAGAACDPSTGDTIDLAVLAEIERRKVPRLPRKRFVPFDPALKRSEAVVDPDGRDVRVVLGSPAIVASLVGRPADGAAVARLSAGGGRVLAVACGSDGALELAGYLALADPPRSDAASLVASLRAMGVRVVMLTGDTPATARAVAAKVGLTGEIGERADLEKDPATFVGFAGVYPEDKYHLVRSLQAQRHVVGMTGDGVNDAPALKQAEVGIAVSGATDVARASARLVLTRGGLSDIVSAVRSGRQVYRRLLTWTLNKVSKNFEQVFLLTVGFVAAGIFVTTPFLIVLLIFANDFVSMAASTDRARVSAAPDRWNVREIAVVAGVVGGTWLALSLGLLAWALTVTHLAVGTLQTFFFVYLVFGSQATLLLVRERGPAWTSRPSTPLLLAVGLDMAAVTGLAVTGTLMPARLDPVLVGSLLAAVALTALAVDRLKVLLIRRTGAFGPGSRWSATAPHRSGGR